MRRHVNAALLLFGWVVALPVLCAADGGEAWWQVEPLSATSQRLREHAMRSISATRLRTAHEQLTIEPHVAGTEGDRRTIQRIADMFRYAGLGVHIDEFWPYLSHPVSASVEVIVMESAGVERERFMLPLRERDLVEDAHASHPELPIGFNAYSGSGAAEGEVVYANYGRREDFERLRELGIDVRGRIVLARYGGNYRGYKALYAEQAGARGLIIYTDPKDSGFSRGEVYPDGGWANDSSIQRGSILTLPYPGDPLTPFHPATKNAPRHDWRTLGLPKIPVQPIGYGAAKEILSRMQGDPVPEDWQGGFEFPYALTGGPSLRLHLNVQQKRSITPTANVIGTIPGATMPNEYVILGCHHDAWGHGASDPLAGMIVLTECARVLGEAAKSGLRPARTIIFAAWGAEEFGIIGSTEWCEANSDMLMRGGVAYINLDMAAMGLNFGSSASPSLRSAIAYAAGLVQQPGASDQTVLQAWLARGDTTQSMPAFGTLGGGSDHVAFYCRLGIPSASLGAGGSSGVAYHSNHDTIAWYQKVVGSDYGSARMVTQVCAMLALELADSPILPIDPRGYAVDAAAQLARLEARADTHGVTIDCEPLKRDIERLGTEADALVAGVKAANFSSAQGLRMRNEVNASLRTLEQCWLVPQGLPNRPWYASLYGAPDPSSGYAAWVFPALRQAIEEGDESAAAEAAAQLVEAVRALRENIAVLNSAMRSKNE